MRRLATSLTTLIGVLLGAAVVAGCAASTTVGTPRTPGTHSTPGSQSTPGTTGTPSTTSIPGAPVYDDNAATVVIALKAGHATVAGDQGSSTLRVFGDGRVERSAEDGISTVRLKLDDAGVGMLLASADRLGLLSDPNLGDVMITDVGSTSLSITLQDRTVALEVIGPEITDVGSPSVRQVRADFNTFVRQLWTLDGVGIDEPPRTVLPKGVVITATTVSSSSSDVPWPLARRAESVFEISSCPVVTGPDVQRVADLLVGQKASSSGRRGEFRVSTGDAGVPTLLVRVSSTQQVCMPTPMEARPLPHLPWNAEDRERSGQWQCWEAIGAIKRAADARMLGIGDPSYLDDYEFDYVSGSVKGVPVVDVVATPDDQHTGRGDIPAFVARVDLSGSGEPVVTQTVKT